MANKATLTKGIWKKLFGNEYGSTLASFTQWCEMIQNNIYPTKVLGALTGYLGNTRRFKPLHILYPTPAADMQKKERATCCPVVQGSLMHWTFSMARLVCQLPQSIRFYLVWHTEAFGKKIRAAKVSTTPHSCSMFSQLTCRS